MLSPDLFGVLMRGIQARSLDWGSAEVAGSGEAFAEAFEAAAPSNGNAPAMEGEGLMEDGVAEEGTGSDGEIAAGEQAGDGDQVCVDILAQLPEKAPALAEDVPPPGAEAASVDPEGVPWPVASPNGPAEGQKRADVPPQKAGPVPSGLPSALPHALPPANEVASAVENSQPVATDAPPAQRPNLPLAGDALPVEPATSLSQQVAASGEREQARAGREVQIDPLQVPKVEATPASGQVSSPAVQTFAATASSIDAGQQGLGVEQLGVTPGSEHTWQLDAQTERQGSLHRAGAAGAPATAAPAAAVSGQVAVAIRTSDSDRIELRLDPPELGRVQIELRIVDGAMHAVLLSERPEVADMLRRQAELLQRELMEAGYTAVTMEFAAGSESGTGERREAQALARIAEGGAAPTPAPTGYQPRRDAAQLDIRL